MIDNQGAIPPAAIMRYNYLAVDLRGLLTAFRVPDSPVQYPKAFLVYFVMATENQALVLIDPLNDFIHPNGKLYPAIQDSLTKTNTIENLSKLAHGARQKGIPIYYGLHQQYKEGNYDGWNHIKPVHQNIKQNQAFAGWGGEILEGFEPQLSNGDVVVSRHWNSRFVCRRRLLVNPSIASRTDELRVARSGIPTSTTSSVNAI